MSTVETNSVILPSNPADKQKILDAIKEIDVCQTHIDAQRDAIKDIADQLKEDYDLPRKLVNQLASTYHKGTYDKKVGEDETFQEAWESIIRSKSSES